MEAEGEPSTTGGDGYDGGDNNGNDNNNDNAQQLHKCKKHFICLFNCNSCHATEAAWQHTIPSNINLIFMDVMC